jgi:8-oxo-dGTP diphosphatase
MDVGLKRAATFIFLRNGTKWLMLERNKAPHKGKFVPVGGKIDPYESPSEAAKREVFEEVGLVLDKELTYCGTLVETSPTSYNWISFIYTTEIEEISLPYCDEGKLLWINDDVISTLDLPPTDLSIINFVKSNQKFALNATFDEDINLVEMSDDLTNKKIL